ncbi:MAG: right-handed parallel beta-helix repeat-containing protein [Alphaproteobacteria bacterium]
MSTYSARTKFSNLLTTSALTAALALSSGVAKADNWVDLTTTAGSTTTDLSTPNTTNINLNTERAIVEGDLDINAGWRVNVSRGDLVAIDRENDPTYIYGSLNCAGTCHVIDKNGIIVGAGGSVDASSVSLSTGEILDRDAFISSGTLKIGNFNDAQILNEGTITVKEGGIAALVSPLVSNAGVINAKLGKVVLAATETATIDPYGDGLFEIALDGEASKAVLENSGKIAAEGGSVQVTAVAVKGAVDNVINMDGVIDVSSVEVKGGKIILHGGNHGNVNVGGKIDASGAQGGDVDIDGNTVTLAESSEINADSNSAEGQAGNIVVWGNRLYTYGELSILGQNGFAETSNREGGEVQSAVFIGENGKWLIDPTNSCIADAAASCAATDTFVDANVLEGNLAAAGANATIDVTTLAAGTDDGNITLVDALDTVTTNTGVTFSLNAHNDIIINNNITDTGLGLNLLLASDSDQNSFGGVYANNAIITTNGGSFTAGGGTDPATTSAQGSPSNKVGIGFTNSQVLTNGGNILLNGEGHNQGDSNYGVFIDNTVLNAGTGTVTINGTGGVGDDYNIGVVLRGASTEILSDTAINIAGTGSTNGNANSDFNYGVIAQSGAKIGASGSSAAITITGTGAAADDNNRGVFINDAGTSVLSDNSITIIGTGGSNGTTDSFEGDGVIINNNAQIGESGSTAVISITGTGAAGEDSNDGVFVNASKILSDNSIKITGTGGSNGGATSNSNYGIFIDTAAEIGESASIASVTLNGTAGAGNDTNHGIVISDAGKVLSNSSINITATGANNGVSTSATNNGLLLARSGQIGDAISAADITITASGVNDFGIDMQTSSSIQSGSGKIDITTSDINIASGTSINAGAGKVDITHNAGGTIALGSATGDLTLDSGELDRISGAALTIGDDTIAQINVNDAVATFTGDLELNATAANGAIDFAGNNRFLNLSAEAASDIDVSSGNLAVTTGDLTLKTQSTAFDQDIVIASGASVTSNNGNITLDSNGTGGGFTTVAGNVDAGTGDLTVNARQFKLNGTSTVNADEVDITAGAVTQGASSTLTANTLTGSISSTASLTSATNNIGTLGNFATGVAGWSTGGLNLFDIDGFDISGAVSTTGGDITLQTGSMSFSQSIDVLSTGSVVSNNGNITLDSNGTGGGFTTVAGNVDAGTGDLTINARQFKLNGTSTVNADEIDVTAGAVTQGASSTLTANTLTGSISSTASFDGTNNNIQTLKDFATGVAGWSTGGLTLVDNGGLEIDGNVSSTGGDIDIATTTTVWSEDLKLNGGDAISSNGGKINLTNNGAGRIIIGGALQTGASPADVTLDAGTGEVQLWNGSSITADTLTTNGGEVRQLGGTITATTLTGSTQKAAAFTGGTNVITTLGDFTTGSVVWHNGGFDLAVTGALDVTGNVSTGGTSAAQGTGKVDINAQGGALTFKSTSGVTTNGGDFDATSPSLIDIDQGANINLGSGNAHIDAPTVNLGDTIVTSGAITGTATTIAVENDDASIQNGIDVAKAIGATLNAAAGTFVENIIVDKELTLNGVAGSTIITYDTAEDGPGRGPNGTVATLAANNIRVEGITFDGLDIADNGIAADGFSNLILHNNDVTKTNANAIFLQNGANLTLTDNVITDGNGNGIQLSGIGNTTLRGNNISSTTLDGVAFGAINKSSIITIAGNDIAADEDAIFFDNQISGKNTLITIGGGAAADANTIVGGDDGIDFDGVSKSKITISGNTKIEGLGSDAIEFDGKVKNGATIDITKNTEIKAAQDGIYFAKTIKGGSTVTIAENGAITGGEEAIEFNKTVDGANVTIRDAVGVIRGDDNGIVFDGVANKANIRITDNGVIEGKGINAGGDGIALNNVDSSSVTISGNTEIDGEFLAGIAFTGTLNEATVLIDNNTAITGDEDGIYVDEITGGAFTVSKNDIDGDLFDGVYIFGEITDATVNIQNNTKITGAENGVNINGEVFGSTITIDGNTITGENDNGVYFGDKVWGGATVNITKNTELKAGDDGVDFTQTLDAATLNISDNVKISAKDDGISIAGDLQNNAIVTVKGNADINTTSGNGIDIADTVDADGADVNVTGNTVTTSGASGVSLSGVDNAKVNENTITDAGANGIEIVGGDTITVFKNTINTPDDHGIKIGDNVTNLDILTNTINSPEEDGILIDGAKSSTITIDGNFIYDPDSEGIKIAAGSDVTITGNMLDGNGNGDTNTTAEGIEIDPGVSAVRILSGNTVTNFDQEGIEIDGNGPNQTDDITISGNTITNNKGDGVEVDGFVTNLTLFDNTITGNTSEGIDIDGYISNPAANITIEQNTISGNGAEGIELSEVDIVNLINNTITGNGAIGIFAESDDNGAITLVGNTVTDHDIGARFESGVIDLSGAANTFTNTNPLGLPVGLQFDLADPTNPASLSLVGNTIGTTAFNGFTNIGSFYVRFEDDALTSGGAPITIDGTNASFDGFVPDSVNNILLPAELAFLEDRIFDADDAPLNGRGQLFVGEVITIDNFEDFLQGRGFGAFGTTGFTLTVTGLPPLSLDFASITPFAGGEGEGNEGFNPADIEPAAGGDEVSCWGDAAGAAGDSGAVTYSFGGSADDLLASAAACGSEG